MKKKIIEFPTGWEEVRPEEWTYLCKLFFELMDRRGVVLIDIKREWVRYVLRNRGVKQQNSLQYYKLVDDLQRMDDWMFVEERGQVGINMTATVNLLPSYAGLVGPADHGADLTFGEYRRAVQMMNSYTSSHDAEWLQALAGILYRKAVKGKRIPFDTSQMDSYIRHAARLPRHVQYGVYLWMAAFSQFLLEGTFIVDGNEVCFSDIFERNGKGGGKNLGMNSILYSMAESGAFGTIEDVDNALLITVLMKLLNDKYKYDELLALHDQKL